MSEFWLVRILSFKISDYTYVNYINELHSFEKKIKIYLMNAKLQKFNH
jgi:hypothetical protein